MREGRRPALPRHPHPDPLRGSTLPKGEGKARERRRRVLAEQPPRRRPRLFGDGRAGQHARDLFLPRAAVHFGDAGRDAVRRRPIWRSGNASPARAATCGACVTDSTCTRDDSRASRWPIASATAPPTPVSISSKTSVGAEPRSASATFSASRKRDSSPPEATFIIGPGRVPGLVRTQNSTWSMPSSVRLSGSLAISTMKSARSSFSAGNSAITAFFSATAAICAQFRKPRGGLVIGVARGRRLLFERDQPLFAGIEIGEVGSHRVAQPGQIVDRDGELARRGAQRKQPLLGPFQPLRIEFGRPQRRIDAGLRRIERDQRLVERFHHLVEQARRFRRLALQAPKQARQLRQRRIRAGQHVLRILDFGRDLFGPHHRGAHVGEIGFLAGLRIELRQFGHRGAQIVGLARRRLDLGAVARKLLFAVAPVPPCRRGRAAPRRHGRRRRRAGRDAREASTSARSSCWPWISTSARPMSRISVTLEGWSLTKTRVRPSAALHAAKDDVAVIVERVVGEDARAPGWLRGTSNTAETWPCAAPWRTSDASPRAPSASDKASSRMDLPAPVSPVSTERPGEKSMSSRSIRTISRIDSLESIKYAVVGQAPPNSFPALEIHEPLFSRGSSPPVCSSA